MKGTLVLFAAVLAGNYIADEFVLKAGPDDPKGFIEVTDGFGMDEIARAAVICATALLAKKLLAKVGG